MNQLTLSQADPEVARLVSDEERREFEKIRLIPSENYVSRAVLEATGSVFTNKYSEGYAGKRYYEGQQLRRPARAARHRARQGALRRRPRQRAALLRLAGQPGGLLRAPQAGRHRHGDGAPARRPPHARLERVDHRRRTSAASSTASTRRPTGSTTTRFGSWRSRSGRSSSSRAPPPTRGSSTSRRSGASRTRSAPGCSSTWRTSRVSWPAARTRARCRTPTSSPPRPTRRFAGRAAP